MALTLGTITFMNFTFSIFQHTMMIKRSTFVSIHAMTSSVPDRSFVKQTSVTVCFAVQHFTNCAICTDV